MESHFLVRNGLAYRCKFNESISLGFRMSTVEFGISKKKKKNAKMEFFVFRYGLAYKCKFDELINRGFIMFRNAHHGIAKQQKNRKYAKMEYFCV